MFSRISEVGPNRKLVPSTSRLSFWTVWGTTTTHLPPYLPVQRWTEPAINIRFTYYFLIVYRGTWFSSVSLLRGCLHDTGATFAPRRVHFGSLSWLYICLHDTTTKSHAGVSSLRLSHRGENFTAARNLATVSCKHETTTRFGVNKSAGRLERVAHA